SSSRPAERETLTPRIRLGGAPFRDGGSRLCCVAMTHDSTQTVATPDGPMELYDAAPEGKPSGAVIVIQEAFGVNEHIRDVTRRFAAAGFRAVAPTMFHRAGGGTAPYGDFSKVMPLFAGVSDAGIVADVDATVGYLHRTGFDDQHIGIVGF